MLSNVCGHCVCDIMKEWRHRGWIVLSESSYFGKEVDRFGRRMHCHYLVSLLVFNVKSHFVWCKVYLQIAVNDVAIVNTPLKVYILRICDYTYTVYDSDSHLQQPTSPVAAYSNVSTGGAVSGSNALLKKMFWNGDFLGGGVCSELEQRVVSQISIFMRGVIKGLQRNDYNSRVEWPVLPSTEPVHPLVNSICDVCFWLEISKRLRAVNLKFSRRIKKSCSLCVVNAIINLTPIEKMKCISMYGGV